MFLNEEGHELNPKEIRQGELIVAKVTLSNAKENYENIIITDYLPAGFEIENPRLASRQQIDWIREKTDVIEYMDLRDDNLSLYVSLPKGRTKVFYYTLRAVSAGSFTLPPIKAEAMYDPSIVSISSHGNIKIVPQ